jgi:hypothetical protein
MSRKLPLIYQKNTHVKDATPASSAQIIDAAPAGGKNLIRGFALTPEK